MSEKGFSGFRKTAPILFYPGPPLSFHPPNASSCFGPAIPRWAMGGGGFLVLASRLHHKYHPSPVSSGQLHSSHATRMACSQLELEQEVG